MIHDLVSREDKVINLEMRLKEREKMENKEFMDQNMGKKDTKKDYERYIQGLVDQQDKIQWEKQTAKWQADEDKRVKLMYEVYDDRVKNIAHKQNIVSMGKEEKGRDKEMVQKLQAEHEESERQKKLKEKEQNV